MNKITPVILAGGIGSRLWPLSRSESPKQFLKFGAKKSIFQLTAERVAGSDYRAPIVVTSEDFAPIVRAQLEEVNIIPELLVNEPVGRNTAPAIVLAALLLRQRGPDNQLLVLPSDHLMDDDDGFRRSVKTAQMCAEGGRLVMFGVEPTRPESGYGYIEVGDAADGNSFSVKSFVEKPTTERAAALIADGSHLWNSGMFLFPICSLLSECQRLNPALVTGCAAALADGQCDGRTYFPEMKKFSELESISIDNVVMEQTDLATVVPLTSNWTDLGSWHAVWQSTDHDAADNAVIGEVIVQNTTQSLVYSPDVLTCVTDMDNVVVVNTGDAVLVTRREGNEGVRDLVSTLQAAGRNELKTPCLVQRPWGSYQSVISGDGYQVKRITVAPGGVLSLQYHHHRSEHWTVVSGTAQVQVADVVQRLTENESVFIPVGELHRLENATDQEVTLIEVQYGSYLGEDDIVRMDDIYGRHASRDNHKSKTVAAE